MAHMHKLSDANVTRRPPICPVPCQVPPGFFDNVQGSGPQRPRGPGTSFRPNTPVVDVPALDDKKALYVARPPKRASDKAKCVDNSKWWARVVLFLCCVSPSNDDGH
ncbi:uncharacterized protein F5891DRAFT_1196195 [Suillus fuscotomentosus]|uniref:Uncharacterized protein n=1 Tax=Suillus fuscotomentosus TaxID=1912939 RepID=A0AAD4DVV8_9AGAM|nr:uncharacterized protein F5891DRAFT_1196195 [Suillus fuscotomentosus]KAG1893568.1 hypothetical protein F5891DRAFT_1196195 [Suillus fuscotomentosus]